MSKIHQGGWVASFVIIGAVLVLGLIGGVYVLRQQSSSQGEVATNDSDSGTSPSEEVNIDDVPAQETPNAPSSTDDANLDASETPKPEDTDKETTAPAPVTENTTTDSEELPATGPPELVASVVAVTALSFSSVGYLQSRRHNA